MTVLAVLIVMLAAAVSLLTVLALLKDSHDSLDRIVAGWSASWLAWRQYRAAGLAGVDRDALADALRPILRLGVLLLILGAAGAVLLDTFNPEHRPSFWTALLLAGLTGHLAIQVPCSWVRYVFIGDRRADRETSRTYTGQERRRHVE